VLDRVVKLVCRMLPAVFGVTVRVHGTWRLDRESTYVFMGNHVNIFDPLIIFGEIPNFVRAIELEDHFSWPVWGTMVRRLGNIPISHTNPRQAVRSLALAGKLLASGTSIGILPEGHRTRNGELGHFMRGPFRLALKAGVDIIPMAMVGAYERKNVHSPVVHPGRMDLVFGSPIRYQEYRHMTDTELRDLVRDAVLELMK